MFDFERPNIEVAEISDDKKYGRFDVEPLERGYGITLGNSLRRIMLSSLPGAAVSQVKIEGVLHEFSSIPGVKEDVTEIVMNIKQLSIKNNGNSVEPKEAHIDFVGEGVVRASDIQVDPDIEIINPELLISKQVFTFNYCYIPKFKRYYYIKNQMLETKNFIRLYLHVDVLMSYQDIIRNSTAQIQVSSSKGNGYYNTSPSYDVRTKYREKLYYNNPFNKDGVNVLLAIKTQ